MRKLDVSKIADALREMAVDVNRNLSEGQVDALKQALARETSPLGKQILRRIIDNAAAARDLKLPACQDTGTAVVFIDIGQEVQLVGGSLRDAVNGATAAAYKEGLLRMSVVNDPLERKNTGTNAPAVLHTRIVPGDRVTVSFMAKGAGCENMSRMKMLGPSDGERGVVDFVVETVVEADGSACPPLVLGIGLGGDFEQVAILAKRALLRHPLGAPNKLGHIAALEKKILDAVNATEIGPMGMGGGVTALAAHIEAAPTHIASLPVAVNLDCHAHRVSTAVL